MKTLTAVAAFLFLTGLTPNLEHRIARIASEIDATVGVAAVHVESGHRVGVRENERFPMGSVNKFPIALAFLRQVDAGRHSLSSEVTIDPAEFSNGYSPMRDAARGRPVTRSLRQLLEAMLNDSDDTAAGVLLKLAGGPAAVGGMMRELGVEGVGDDATPAAFLALMERFYARQAGLSAGSHEVLMRTLAASRTGERRIKAGAPARSVVAHKTGTMPGTVNDIGIITSPGGKDHILLVVFTTGGRASTLTQRERAVASITRAIYRDWVGARSRNTTRPPRAGEIRN